MFRSPPIKIHCRDCEEKSCAAAILSPAELDTVHANSREAEFSKGDILIHEGSFNSHIIYLKSGLVKEFTRSNGKKEQILQIVKRYTYLGLPSLFGDRVNHYSYSALTDVKVCYIDNELFRKLIHDNGAFAYNILVSVSSDSLHNFRRFINKSHQKTYGKVADALIYFSTIIFESPDFEIPFTRQEFADLIGISRESATRVLLKFRDDGIVSLEDRRVIVHQPEMLTRISQLG